MLAGRLAAEVRLDIAIWMAVFGTPWVIAAQLLWRAWWRQAGAELSGLDGAGLLLAAGFGRRRRERPSAPPLTSSGSGG